MPCLLYIMPAGSVERWPGRKTWGRQAVLESNVPPGSTIRLSNPVPGGPGDGLPNDCSLRLLPRTSLMKLRHVMLPVALVAASLASVPTLGQNKPAPKEVNIKPPHIASDKAVKYDYDILYVRAPRHGDDKRTRWADFSDPT